MKILLTAILLLSATAYSQNLKVNFHIDTEDTTDNYSVETAKFYISNIRVKLKGGGILSKENGYFLIDLEDTTSGIINMPSFANLEIDSIFFSIGTDSLINIAGVMDGDLDPLNGMYWAWNTGYINFKVEGTVNKSGSNMDLEYHIGGYKMPYQTVRNLSFPVNSNNLIIHLDLISYMSQAQQISNSILIPGDQASKCADLFMKCFSVDE